MNLRRGKLFPRFHQVVQAPVEELHCEIFFNQSVVFEKVSFQLEGDGVVLEEGVLVRQVFVHNGYDG